MGAHKHEARTRTDRLIQSVDALTATLREVLERLPVVEAATPQDFDNSKIALLSKQ